MSFAPQQLVNSFLEAAARGDTSELERLAAADGNAVIQGCDEDGQVSLQPPSPSAFSCTILFSAD